jgi:hypothetical protein
MTTNPDEWTKELETDLTGSRPTCGGLAEKGFWVDGDNKSPSGWSLTASNRNTSRSIRVQSDGTKLVVTAEG